LKQPFLFINAAYDCVVRAVEYQCSQVLGRENYRRLNPPVAEAMGASQETGGELEHVIANLRDALEKTANETDLVPTLEFLDRSNWILPPANREPEEGAPVVAPEESDQPVRVRKRKPATHSAGPDPQGTGD
jgi:hypothetical protein